MWAGSLCCRSKMLQVQIRSGKVVNPQSTAFLLKFLRLLLLTNMFISFNKESFLIMKHFFYLQKKIFKRKNYKNLLKKLPFGISSSHATKSSSSNSLSSELERILVHSKLSFGQTAGQKISLTSTFENLFCIFALNFFNWNFFLRKLDELDFLMNFVFVIFGVLTCLVVSDGKSSGMASIESREGFLTSISVRKNFVGFDTPMDRRTPLFRWNFMICSCWFWVVWYLMTLPSPFLYAS